MGKSFPSAEMSVKQMAIIEAASRLIVEKGVENTSLGEIAREVGISKGTLYYYYASKNDLIFDVTEHHFSKITQGLLSWIEAGKDETNPREIFRVVFDTVVGAQERGRLHIYLLKSVAESDEQLRERFRQKYQEWQWMIEVGLNAILGERAEFKPLAALILAALDGFVIQAYVGIEPMPVDSIIDWLVSKM